MHQFSLGSPFNLWSSPWNWICLTSCIPLPLLGVSPSQPLFGIAFQMVRTCQTVCKHVKTVCILRLSFCLLLRFFDALCCIEELKKMRPKTSTMLIVIHPRRLGEAAIPFAGSTRFNCISWKQKRAKWRIQNIAQTVCKIFKMCKSFQALGTKPPHSSQHSCWASNPAPIEQMCFIRMKQPRMPNGRSCSAFSLPSFDCTI